MEAGGAGSNPVTRTDGHSSSYALGSAEMVLMWRMTITFGEWCSGNTTYFMRPAMEAYSKYVYALEAVVRGPIPLSPTIVNRPALFGVA